MTIKLAIYFLRLQRIMIYKISFKFPDPGDNPNIAVREGYEVQIDNSAGDPIHQTGAIYDFAAPSKISKPLGQWNKMEIQ
jgi:cytochrome c